MISTRIVVAHYLLYLYICYNRIDVHRAVQLADPNVIEFVR
jgi:hypothetical protein